MYVYVVRAWHIAYCGFTMRGNILNDFLLKDNHVKLIENEAKK